MVTVFHVHRRQQFRQRLSFTPRTIDHNRFKTFTSFFLLLSRVASTNREVKFTWDEEKDVAV